MREFTSSAQAAERENRLVALLVLLGVPLLLWLLRGERSPLVLAGAGVAGAVIAYAFYRWRDARARVLVLRLDDEGLEARRRGGTVRLRWAEVRAARRASYGGAHWVLQDAASRWHVVRLDGFAPAQVAQIDAIVGAHAAPPGRARATAR